MLSTLANVSPAVIDADDAERGQRDDEAEVAPDRAAEQPPRGPGCGPVGAGRDSPAGRDRRSVAADCAGSGCFGRLTLMPRLLS